MNTALIIRPKDAPKIHVLEVDGPRRRYATNSSSLCDHVQTNNQPICTDWPWATPQPDPRLKHWDEPHWEIYQYKDGSVQIHACRPTRQEMMRGDLHGRWGSVIHLRKNPRRPSIQIGLSLARMLCKCLPNVALHICDHVALHVDSIETEIPLRLACGLPFATLPKAS
jgi:hypothetical protein